MIRSIPPPVYSTGGFHTLKNTVIADNKPVKIALAKGLEMAGTAIGSGERGMLAEEQAASRRYVGELASVRFSYRESLREQVQAFHFKKGPAANICTGVDLPGNKNTAKIAAVRGVAFALGRGADYIMLEGRGEGRCGPVAVSGPTKRPHHPGGDVRAPLSGQGRCQWACDAYHRLRSPPAQRFRAGRSGDGSSR